MRIITEPTESAESLLPFHLTTVGTEFNQPPAHRPNGIRFHQFLRIEQGVCRVETAEKVMLLEPGSILFTAKGLPVSYRAEGEYLQTGWVTFDGPFAEALLRYAKTEPCLVLNSATVYRKIDQIVRLAGKGGSELRLSCAVYELCATFFDELRLCRQSPSLLRAKRFMEEHATEDLAISRIADAAGISESLLFRLFHTEEQTTPVDYLRRIRIQRARDQLVNLPKKRIAQIAADCGFTDPSYFCRVFRSQTGITPGECRRRYSE